MATTNCKDCPSSCLGHDLSDLCVYHDDSGESLNGIIKQLRTTDDAGNPTTQIYTTDDIVSLSNARNTESMCASKITKRDFTYSLSTSSTNTTFGWNLTGFASSLPSGYRIATVRVRVTGMATTAGNVISDSSSLSSGININLDKYPVTADFVIRITSECGNIDMESKIVLSNPTATGTFSGMLTAQDLNPATTQGDLTSQLDTLESKVFDLGTKVETLQDVDGSDIKSKVVTNEADIATLQSELSALGKISISYIKDGATKTDTLETIINDLYARIATLG